MQKLMALLMLSCIKASELVEKKSVHKLTFWERIKLKIHIKMCNACTSYQKHSHTIDILIREQFNNNDGVPMIENKPLQERIKKLI